MMVKEVSSASNQRTSHNRGKITVTHGLLWLTLESYDGIMKCKVVLLCQGITCFSWKHKPLLLTWTCSKDIPYTLCSSELWFNHRVDSAQRPTPVLFALCWDARTIQMTVILKSSQGKCTCASKKKQQKNSIHTILKLQAWKSQQKSPSPLLFF